ncbi:hypothetical protein EDB85DRAFT_1954024 [Lactarius pseudohatsudake]|nr:hypothetical protein EDB85DRAFT_1954024 [Lactarius pseudohatsudake]
MRYHRIFLLSVLAAIPLAGLAMPHSPRWGEMSSKHSWAAVPEDWQCLGPPPNDTTADLYIALKSHGGENTLIDALYEVSTPGRSKYVFSSTPLLTRSPLLWCRYGVHLSREQVAKLVCCSAPAHCPFLARVLIPSSSVSMSHALPATLHEHVQTVAQNARSGRYPATVMAGQQRRQQNHRQC